MDNDVVYPRRIKSYVLREGRMTDGQRRAMKSRLERYGVPAGSDKIDLGQLFGREAPRIIEIGFGMGTSLIEMAKASPENDYLGIEVHRPGVGTLLRQVDELGLSNIRVACIDAVELLDHRIPETSLKAIHLFFPDPWHKKRHNKRRIVQPNFIASVSRLLCPKGQFHMATDWENYAHQMMRVMSASPNYRNCAGDLKFSERPDYRPLTKFELRGQRLGHGVWDLIFERM
ncbi:MAG: tRNA (guanosine(46)-N7)-methyltransferase TrmB [Gammaproteobacteria bacterium]|nr:tRNA (guanosine(46)-N7)-methyltransferase TrmB [Gammaproteobacteria bacterium]